MTKYQLAILRFTMSLILCGAVVGVACASAIAPKEPRSNPPVAPPQLSEDPNELLWHCREERRWGIVLDSLFWSNYKTFKDRWTKELQDELLWIKTRPEYVEIFYLENIKQSRADGSLGQKLVQARDELAQIRERRIKLTQKVLRDVFETKPGVGILELFDLPPQDAQPASK
ncbi:MAG: hypothetical protein KF691_00150 [Phycisphaeraceae bacterium]|nr:hypothetical protein [Phycisphaeraceae bacterium]